MRPGGSDGGPGAQRTASRRYLRRASMAVAGLSLVLVAGTTVPAFAGGGTVGDPQPELAKFKVGAIGGTGTGVVLPNGDVLLASPSKSGTTIAVCRLVPGGRSCASTATLHAYKSGSNHDIFSGTVVVLSTGGQHVSVVAEDCCYIPPSDGGVALYDSTDGGRTFGPEFLAGTMSSVGSATYLAPNIVVANDLSSAQTEVQAFIANPGSEQTSIAVASTYEGDTVITKYRTGVLVANDNLKNTRVEIDRYGGGLNSGKSYVTVGVFGNEQVLAASDGWLLTDPGGSLTGGVRLRLFNGTSYGAAHKVPEPKDGDDGYWALQSAGGVAHVFFIDRRSGYDLFTETTGNGVRFSPLQQFSSAITASSVSAALGSLGTGVAFENDGTPLYAQPILNPRSVHVAFVAPHVRAGAVGVLRGSSDPTDSHGLVITLEHLVAGRWYPVKSIRTNPQSFTFHVSGVTATYRAVVEDVPGYYQYGYSNPATIVAVR